MRKTGENKKNEEFIIRHKDIRGDAIFIKFRDESIMIKVHKLELIKGEDESVFKIMIREVKIIDRNFMEDIMKSGEGDIDRRDVVRKNFK